MGKTDSQRAGLLPGLPSPRVEQLDGTPVDCPPLGPRRGLPSLGGCAHLFLKSRQPAGSSNAQGRNSWTLPGLGCPPHWNLWTAWEGDLY